MAISPGRTAVNETKARESAEYANSLVEIPLEQLPAIMSPAEAFIVDTFASLGEDVLQAEVSDKARTAARNKGDYNDDAEDYIFGSEALREYISEMRKTESRESAERVRMLRSARAVLYYAVEQEQDTNSTNKA